MKAIEDCQVCVRFQKNVLIGTLTHCMYFAQNSDVPLLKCVEDAIGAASECFRCICEIVNVISGGDGKCDVNTSPPK